MTLDQVKPLPGNRFDGFLSRGYGDGTIWVRLRIDPAPAHVAPSDTLYLGIRPTYLDQITLYDPLRTGEAPIVHGDSIAMHADEKPSAAILFKLQAGDRPRDLWLAIRSTSTRTAHFELWNEREQEQVNTQDVAWSSILMGGITFSLLWGLVLLATDRSILIKLYLVSVSMNWIFSFSASGLSRYFFGHQLPPWVIDYSITLSVPLYAVSGLLYIYLLLRQNLVIPRWVNAVNINLLAFTVTELVLIGTGRVSTALQINSYFIMIMPFIALVIAHISKAPPSSDDLPQVLVPRHLIIGYCWLVTLTISIYAALITGLLQTSHSILLYAPITYSLYSTILMLIVLQYRNHRFHQREKVLYAQNLNHRTKAEQEQKHREAKDKLLSMLNHEIKTPLASIRMLGAVRGLPQAVSSDINELSETIRHLLDRSMQSNDIEDGNLRIISVDFPLEPLLQQACQNLPGAERIQYRGLNQDIWLHTDPIYLEVILKNLVENALKYGSPDKPVLVLILHHPSDHQVHIEVANPPGSGGWPDPEKIFTKYYRSRQAATQSGTGLGLYLSRGLAQMLDARLEYVTDADQVRFRLTATTTARKAL